MSGWHQHPPSPNYYLKLHFYCVQLWKANWAVVHEHTHTCLAGMVGMCCVRVCLCACTLYTVAIHVGGQVGPADSLTFNILFILYRAATCPLLFAPVWRTRVNELSPQRGKHTLHLCAECLTSTIVKWLVAPCERLFGIMNSSFLYDECQLPVLTFCTVFNIKLAVSDFKISSLVLVNISSLCLREHNYFK